MAAPSLSLERAATLRAELDLSDRPDDILTREGLTRTAWEAGLEKLLVELADDIDRGEVERAERFAAAYDEARAARLGQAAPISRAAPAAVAAPDADGSSAPEGDFDPDATSMTDQRAVLQAVRAKGLPFDAGAAPAAPPPAMPIAQEQSGETVDIEELRKQVKAELASRAAAPASPPVVMPPTMVLQSAPLTVERFAELQALLSRSPDRNETLRAYGVDPAAWTDILKAFGESMKSDPALRARYERLLYEAMKR